MFDPLTRWHSDHPSNLVLIDARETLATSLEEAEAAIAVAIALAVAVILVKRWLAETAPARRQLMPVICGGAGGLADPLDRARARAALVGRRRDRDRLRPPGVARAAAWRSSRC